MSKAQICTQNANLFTLALYILNNLVIHQNWENDCIMKKHALTTEIWHQSNTVILFGCKMNWLSTICISEQDFVGIWQKYVVETVKNHEKHKNHIYLTK